MRVAALLALLALLLAVLVPRAAVAQGATGNPGIDAGIAYYDDLEYEKAVAALEPALAEPGLSLQEASAGLRVLALAYLALGRDDDARAAFGRLLDLAPDYRLPATDNPRAIALLDEVRASRPAAHPAAGPARLDVQVAPEHPAPGATLSFTVTLDDPEHRAATVVLYHRAAGGKSYSSIKSAAAPTLTVSLPGAFVTDAGIDWYVVAETADGQPVAGLGSPSSPRHLDVHTRHVAAAPVYKQWWFWTGIGAVAAGVTAFILLSGDDDGGTATGDTAPVVIVIGD